MFVMSKCDILNPVEEFLLIEKILFDIFRSESNSFQMNNSNDSFWDLGCHNCCNKFIE